MRRKFSFLSLLLALCLVFFTVLPVAAEGDPNAIIQEIMNYYQHYESDAMTDVCRLLDQLEAIDGEKADNWRKIVAKWEYAVNELDNPYGCLPDGLPQDDSLCIVVMGYVLNADGSMRKELIGRCQVALNSYQKYPNAYIICTGGGTASGNSRATEAGQMAKWLIEHGVKEDRIIVEDRSISTEENAMFSMDILKSRIPQVNTLALVSSDYHLRRCYVLFEAALALNDWDEDYTVAGTAAYDAGKPGNEGSKTEAEGLGKMVNIYIKGLGKPKLSVPEGLLVQGKTEYLTGDELALRISAFYNTDYTRDVTPNAVYTGHDPSQPSVQDITIQYTENGITLTSTLQITVKAPPIAATQTQTAPADTEPPAETEIPAPAVQEYAEDNVPAWILWIPSFLAVILIFKVNELIRRRQRKKKRPRKKMEWD